MSAEFRDGLVGLPAGLTQAFIQIPEGVDDLQQRGRLRFADGFDVKDTPLGSGGHKLHELPTVGHVRRDLESTNVVGPFGVGVHSQSPCVARVAARYVAGALFLLAALWWLQRKAWVRRAATFVSRPSGTTGGGAA